MQSYLRCTKWIFLFSAFFIGLPVCAGPKVIDEKAALFWVEPTDAKITNNADLLERLRASPHGYFRFISATFSREICARFADVMDVLPACNLHGDAHLEQYAVTESGRGLTDFDDASTGPAIIDLMRFGVSIHLACRQLGWENQADSLMAIFIAGYRSGLLQTDGIFPEPKLAKQIRAEFKNDPAGRLKSVCALMKPFPAEERQRLIESIQPYVARQLAQHLEYPINYFDIIDMGPIQIGIGSALDQKYVLRVQGQTADSLDDVVLEIKEVRGLSGIDCISTKNSSDPFRVLLGETRMAYDPSGHLGYCRFNGRNFWLHSWGTQYQELKIGKSFKNIEALAEIVKDAGFQLGRGHVNFVASPLDWSLRQEQLGFIDREESRIHQNCTALADSVETVWQKFCAQIK